MLAGRPHRTAPRRGCPFLSERCDGILVHEGFLTQPVSIHIDVPIFTYYFFRCVSLFVFVYPAHSGIVYIHCVSQATGSELTEVEHPQTTTSCTLFSDG